uniref:Tudor-knot domain-containing protein n=1 Tax=Globisporangium ultimum (strain ATCC 200006 / CBS 805.95 / DAOM BR144) TaxID=431595 RepID=K3WPV2_GLOUD
MAASVAPNSTRQGVQTGLHELAPPTASGPLSQPLLHQQPSMETTAATVPGAEMIPAVADSLAMTDHPLLLSLPMDHPATPPADAITVEKQTKQTSKAAAKQKKGKPNGKKKKAAGPPSAPCVGLYVDALDTKMLWAEAQIIDCKLEEQKIKVHFIGWKSRWDIWTDAMSIAGHGTYVPLTKKNLAMSRRWDGHSDIFSLDPSEFQSGAANSIVPLVEEKSNQTSVQRVVTPRANGSDKSAARPHLPQPVVTNKAPAASRKPRPAKLRIEDSAKAETKKFPRKNGRTGVFKPSLTAKKAAPQAPATPAARTTAATPKRAPLPVSAPEKKRAGPSPSAVRDAKRLKAIADLLPVDNSIDFAAIRKLNTDEDAQTANFLQRCADVWKRQLSGLSTRQQT